MSSRAKKKGRTKARTNPEKPILVIGAAAFPDEPGAWETGMRVASWGKLVDAWLGTEYEPLLHRIKDGNVIHYDMEVFPERGDALDHFRDASVVIADHLYYDDDASRKGFFYNQRNHEIIDEADRAGVPSIHLRRLPVASSKAG